jgi:hypothetical protein
VGGSREGDSWVSGIVEREETDGEKEGKSGRANKAGMAS